MKSGGMRCNEYLMFVLFAQNSATNVVCASSKSEALVPRPSKVKIERPPFQVVGNEVTSDAFGLVCGPFHFFDQRDQQWTSAKNNNRSSGQESDPRGPTRVGSSPIAPLPPCRAPRQAVPLARLRQHHQSTNGAIAPSWLRHRGTQQVGPRKRYRSSVPLRVVAPK